jgi:UDP-GlcNAc:undecaprenyl-phosphate GlcNAc-1-phosphate transferase
MPQLTSISVSSFIFSALLLSLLLVLALAWASIRLARRLRLIDFPESLPHKKHARPTPLAGGIALFITLLLCELVLGTFADPNVKAAFLAMLPIFFFGLLDDYKNISPSLKLLGQAVSAVLLIYLGVTIKIFESPEFFIHGTEPIYVYLDWLITILWLVGITNAFNFVDSMDGLAVGLGAMAASFFVLVTLDAQQALLSQHSAVLIGICIGLYFFNSPPALLFMGDSGAQALGFLLAALAISYNPQGAYQTSSWLVPILLLGVPIFDTTLVIISRLRSRRPLYAAALDHTYHRLLNQGLQPSRAVLVMQTASLALSCLAFIVLNQPPQIANLAFALVLALAVLALFYFENKNK